MFHVEHYSLTNLPYELSSMKITGETFMDSNAPKRGLGALLQSTTSGVEATSSEKSKVQIIPILSIRANKDQPRRTFDESALSELSDSIRLNGLT